MHFILMVTGPSYGTQQASSAYQFSKALLSSGHKIISIFFYREGVYNANLLSSPDTDELNLVKSWKDLHEQYGVILYVCTAAALRRGIVNHAYVQSDSKGTVSNLQKGFLFAGLYTLAQAVLTCDRMVQF